jgi:hypothetical protein
MRFRQLNGQSGGGDLVADPRRPPADEHFPFTR